jgi:putative intracellular protease/amidase
LNAAALTIGTVLFDGFELLDVFGPLEMLGRLDPAPRLLMIAETAGPVRSNQGPSCVADAELAGDTPLDILLVPGGPGTRREAQNPGFLESLSARALSTRTVATVCTGSALLARTGLLDGRRATTNKRAFRWVASQGPAVAWVAEARWVEDGKFFTASGVSAGMDMALGLIARLRGREAAIGAANGTEYAWHEDSGWDPFAKLNGLVP